MPVDLGIKAAIFLWQRLRPSGANMIRTIISIFVVLVATHMGLAVLAENQVPRSAVEMKLSFAPVVKASAPSVVNIYARRVVEAKENPFANDPFFADLFRNFGKPAPQVQNSLGSGVILSPDGLIVSNYHVVGGATEIRVVLNDRREFDAKVLLADEISDLAVLKVEGASALPAMPLRPSDQVEVGELVLAIGNPFGVGQTVSSGIISGLARSGGAVGNARAYFIQTDAPINPGNSGGALVDMDGRLVGINTSILTRSGGSNGIGFAIPADLVATFLVQARQGNHSFARPWAGIVGQMMDSSLAKGFELERPEGMVVVEMHPESPFAKAGIRAGDVIIAFNGRLVNGPAEMLYHMSVAGIGNAATIEYVRGNQKLTTSVSMISPPDTPAREARVVTQKSPLQGLTLVQINPAVISELGLPTTANGVAVTAAEGIAASIGFKPGDILRVVNGKMILHPADAVTIAGLAQAKWEISIERNGQTLSMRIRP